LYDVGHRLSNVPSGEAKPKTYVGAHRLGLATALLLAAGRALRWPKPELVLCSVLVKKTKGRRRRTHV
jgi:hypothetical protein